MYNFLFLDEQSEKGFERRSGLLLRGEYHFHAYFQVKAKQFDCAVFRIILRHISEIVPYHFLAMKCLSVLKKNRQWLLSLSLCFYKQKEFCVFPYIHFIFSVGGYLK